VFCFQKSRINKNGGNLSPEALKKNVFEMVLEKCEKTALTEKNFEKKNSQTPFVFLYFNLLTIKI